MTVAVVMALLIPSSGILRALAALFRHSCFSHGDELQKAARAGALCMVTRDAFWIPRDRDLVRVILPEVRGTESGNRVSSNCLPAPEAQHDRDDSASVSAGM